MMQDPQQQAHDDFEDSLAKLRELGCSCPAMTLKECSEMGHDFLVCEWDKLAVTVPLRVEGG